MELQIPTVDLHDLSSGEPARVARASAAIREAFGVYGLIYIRNHGVDGGDLGAFYDAFRAFVARPEADKRPYGRADLW